MSQAFVSEGAVGEIRTRQGRIQFHPTSKLFQFQTAQEQRENPAEHAPRVFYIDSGLPTHIKQLFAHAGFLMSADLASADVVWTRGDQALLEQLGEHQYCSMLNNQHALTRMSNLARILPAECLLRTLVNHDPALLQKNVVYADIGAYELVHEIDPSAAARTLQPVEQKPLLWEKRVFTVCQYVLVAEVQDMETYSPAELVLRVAGEEYRAEALTAGMYFPELAEDYRVVGEGDDSGEGWGVGELRQRLDAATRGVLLRVQPYLLRGFYACDCRRQFGFFELCYRCDAALGCRLAGVRQLHSFAHRNAAVARFLRDFLVAGMDAAAVAPPCRPAYAPHPPPDRLLEAAAAERRRRRDARRQPPRQEPPPQIDVFAVEFPAQEPRAPPEAPEEAEQAPEGSPEGQPEISVPPDMPLHAKMKVLPVRLFYDHGIHSHLINELFTPKQRFAKLDFSRLTALERELWSAMVYRTGCGLRRLFPTTTLEELRPAGLHRQYMNELMACCLKNYEVQTSTASE